MFPQDNLEETKVSSSLSPLRAPSYLLSPQCDVWTMAAAAAAVLTHDPGPIGAMTSHTPQPHPNTWRKNKLTLFKHSPQPKNWPVT